MPVRFALYRNCRSIPRCFLVTSNIAVNADVAIVYVHLIFLFLGFEQVHIIVASSCLLRPAITRKLLKCHYFNSVKQHTRDFKTGMILGIK